MSNSSIQRNQKKDIKQNNQRKALRKYLRTRAPGVQIKRFSGCPQNDWKELSEETWSEYFRKPVLTSKSKIFPEENLDQKLTMLRIQMESSDF